MPRREDGRPDTGRVLVKRADSCSSEIWAEMGNITMLHRRSARFFTSTALLLLHAGCPNNNRYGHRNRLPLPGVSPRPPRPQPPGSRIGCASACLNCPYSSLRTLECALVTAPAPDDLLPLRASHARGPITFRSFHSVSLTAVATSRIHGGLTRTHHPIGQLAPAVNTLLATLARCQQS